MRLQIGFQTLVDKKTVRRWAIVGIVLGAIVCAACALVAFHYKDVWVPLYVEGRDSAVQWLQNVPPLLFFIILATVPVLPVPMSLFYLSTGVFPWPVALLGICVAIPINLALSYFMVRTFMRPLALRILGRMGIAIPKAKTKKGEVMFSILVRICGMPYAPQNYILALSHIPFRTYMLVGIPLQVLPAIAMMFLGDSIMHGEGKKALIALVAIAAIVIVTKLLRDYLKKRRPSEAEGI